MLIIAPIMCRGFVLVLVFVMQYLYSCLSSFTIISPGMIELVALLCFNPFKPNGISHGYQVNQYIYF